MKNFSDIYTESSSAATLTLGYGQLNGKLVVASTFVDEQNHTQTWGSFAYDGAKGTLYIGSPEMGLPGKLVIGDAGTSSQNILLDAATNTLELGGSNLGNGHVSLKNRTGAQVALLSAETCSLTIGCKSTATNDNTGGQIFLCNKEGVQTAVLNGRNGNLTLGGAGVHGDIIIKSENDIETIKILGSSGDMQFLNADLAEEFDVAPDALSEARPGMVVVLDGEGRLVPCARPYDSKVVGILAGAGNYRPGIVLDKQPVPSRRPVTLVGKAFCWVDAQRDPVRAGDLLTTSANPGHAMRASSRRRSAGAVIGKALRPLLSGTGLVPVLVMPN